MSVLFSTRLASSAILAAVAMLAGTASGTAFAAEDAQGDWMVRLRATYLDMANKSDAIPALGVPSDAIHVNNKWIPEVDVTYFFTPNIAAELVLTIPQKQDVTLNGTKIGTFSHLPPTLMAQYHFIPNGTFRPYVGAGINVTRIWNADISAAGIPLTLSKWSVGPALQIGMDYKLTKNWFLNADVKKIWLGADVNAAANGSRVTKVSLDPWLFSMGVGYRF